MEDTMKCIKTIEGKHLRLADKAAIEAVAQGAQYVTKTEWKVATGKWPVESLDTGMAPIE